MLIRGQILAGKFKLERLIGKGSFSTVWEAQNQLIRRQVALKILHEVYATDPKVLARFLREAKIASQPLHPVILAVEDIAVTQEGVVFLVMDLLVGTTLDYELRERGVFPLNQTVEIICLVLEGLAAAHRAGVVHRDIKPANVFLTSDRSYAPPVRISDLGLAKEVDDEDLLTTLGSLVGTPDSISPEVLLPTKQRHLIPTRDVFACGMLLFGMLAGRLPFEPPVRKVKALALLADRVKPYKSITALPGPADFDGGIPLELDAVVRRHHGHHPVGAVADLAVLDRLREDDVVEVAVTHVVRAAVQIRTHVDRADHPLEVGGDRRVLGVRVECRLVVAVHAGLGGVAPVQPVAAVARAPGSARDLRAKCHGIAEA